MKGFRVKGSFADKRAKNGRQVFTIEIAAEDEASAKEQTVSTMGSKHKLKRWEIAIDEISELAADQVESHVVKYKIGA
jgi:large subunit ribosomal protein LX